MPMPFKSRLPMLFKDRQLKSKEKQTDVEVYDRTTEEKEEAVSTQEESAVRSVLGPKSRCPHCGFDFEYMDEHGRPYCIYCFVKKRYEARQGDSHIKLREEADAVAGGLAVDHALPLPVICRQCGKAGLVTDQKGVWCRLCGAAYSGLDVKKKAYSAVDKGSENVRSETKVLTGKIRLTLVPLKIIWAIGRVREYGMTQYKGRNSYKNNSKRDYQDAAMRHFFAYLEDNDSLDEKSGLPHLHHLACNIAFLIEDDFKKEDDDV